VAAGESIDEALNMNFPKIYRRFAAAAIGILIVGLIPASALAVQTEVLDVQISGGGSAVAGATLDVTVTAYDPAGDLVTPDPLYTGTIHFTSTDSQAVLPEDCTFSGTGVCFSHDVLAFGTAAPAQSVTVTDLANSDNTGTSSGVAVLHAALNHFTAITPAADTIAAHANEVYTVTGVDSFANTWDATSTTDFAIDGDGSCVANSCSSDTAGGYTVTASDQTTPSITISTGLTVTAASMNKLVITGPTTATAGVSGLYTVTAEDAYGNPILDYAGSITITSGDSTMSSVVNTALANGVEKFDVTLNTAGLQTVGATDGVHTASPSVSVTVGSSSLNKLVITGPTTATAGVSGLYTVTAEDQFGNPITSYAGTIAITSGDSTMSSVIHTALANGVEKFDVTLDTAGSQTVGAFDGALTAPAVTVSVTHAVMN
jgi:hypothetical protein